MSRKILFLFENTRLNRFVFGVTLVLPFGDFDKTHSYHRAISPDSLPSVSYRLSIRLQISSETIHTYFLCSYIFVWFALVYASLSCDILIALESSLSKKCVLIS